MIKLTSETISFIILLLAIPLTSFGFSLIYRSILLELKESKKLKYKSKAATTFLACLVMIISVNCFHIFSNSNLFYIYLPVSIIAFILPDLRYRRAKKLRKWSFRRNGMEYELYEVDLQLPNAYTLGKKKIGYTSKLREILTDEEFKAIILHEIGHMENKLLDCLLRISVALWILVSPFIVLILGYLIGNFFVKLDLNYLRILVSHLLILYYLSVNVTLISWIYEHVADLHASSELGSALEKALVKVLACLRLSDLCNRSSIEQIEAPKIEQIRYIDVLTEIRSLILRMPLNIIDLITGKTYISHPPLKFRLFVVQDSK